MNIWQYRRAFLEIIMKMRIKLRDDKITCEMTRPPIEFIKKNSRDFIIYLTLHPFLTYWMIESTSYATVNDAIK